MKEPRKVGRLGPGGGEDGEGGRVCGRRCGAWSWATDAAGQPPGRLLLLKQQGRPGLAALIRPAPRVQRLAAPPAAPSTHRTTRSRPRPPWPPSWGRPWRCPWPSPSWRPWPPRACCGGDGSIGRASVLVRLYSPYRCAHGKICDKVHACLLMQGSPHPRSWIWLQSTQSACQRLLGTAGWAGQRRKHVPRLQAVPARCTAFGTDG